MCVCVRTFLAEMAASAKALRRKLCVVFKEQQGAANEGMHREIREENRWEGK